MRASDHINGKSLNLKSENVNSGINLHRGNSALSRLDLKKKNAEIDRLRHQLEELSVFIWHAEQSISELQWWIDKLTSNENQFVRNNINRIIKQLLELKTGENQDSQVLANQEFIKKLQMRFPVLSSNDLRICSLLRLNFSTKEIAQKLGIGSASANKARYRIRKKLALRREQELVGYLIEF